MARRVSVAPYVPLQKAHPNIALLDEEKIKQHLQSFEDHLKRIPSESLSTILKELGFPYSKISMMINRFNADQTQKLIDSKDVLEFIKRETKDFYSSDDIFQLFDNEVMSKISVSDAKSVFKNLAPKMSKEEIEEIISDLDDQGCDSISVKSLAKWLTEV